MDETKEIQSLIARCAPQTQSRLQLLFYALLMQRCPTALDEGHCADNNDDDLGVSTIAHILKFAIGAPPPRFLLALSGNDMLLRSSDKGKSWSVVYDHRKATSSEGGALVPAEAPAADSFEAITQLLADGARPEQTDGSDGGGGDAKAKESLLDAVHGHGDTIALCGRVGALAVSCNRGVSFTTTVVRLAGEAESPPDLVATVVCHSGLLFVASDTAVASVEIGRTEEGAVTLGEPRTVLQSSSRICLLTCLPHAGGAEVVVGERDALHFSWNEGKSFTMFPHQLGTIRSATAVEMRRPNGLPAYQSSWSPFREGERKAESAAPDEGRQYEYIRGLEDKGAARDHDALWQAVRRRWATPKGAEHTRYHYYLVAGAGTEVLAYDYTALLCVAVQRDAEGVVSRFTAGLNVSYIPFTHSNLSEKVMCAALGEAAGKHLFVRGNSGGVSFSEDLKKWTNPHGAGAVGVCPSDGAEVLVGSRRSVVTVYNPDGKVVRTSTIHADARVPYIKSFVSM